MDTSTSGVVRPVSRLALLVAIAMDIACAGGDAAAPAPRRSCYAPDQVADVIRDHQRAVRQMCWEYNPTKRPTVLVTVSMTIGRDGVPEEAESAGEEDSVAACVRKDVQSWRFPALGCEQKTTFSFHFVRK